MNEKEGVISIVALWIVAILAILALGLARRMSLELKLTAYQVDRLRTTCLAEAGVNQAMLKLERDSISQYDALNESWGYNPSAFRQVKLGRGTFSIGYPLARREHGDSLIYGVMDEERKININSVSDTLLMELFQVLGESPDTARELAASIVDWRDTDSSTLPGGAEERYYQGLDPPYHCKNGNFEVVEELMLVKGVTPERLDMIRDFVTVYGDGAVNINTASREVLTALMATEKPLVDWGIDKLVDRIIRFREGDDGVVGTKDDGVFTRSQPDSILEFLGFLDLAEKRQLRSALRGGMGGIEDRICLKSSYFRIQSVGLLEGGRVSRRVTAVVERGENSLSSIRFWHEE